MVQTQVTEQYGINEQAGSARRGVRVVYGDGLENRCPRKGTVGSNPTPSATTSMDRL